MPTTVFDYKDEAQEHAKYMRSLGYHTSIRKVGRAPFRDRYYVHSEEGSLYYEKKFGKKGGLFGSGLKGGK